MLNLSSTETSTFLLSPHAYTLFNLFFWLHQEVFRWSHWRWAKQLTLSWQNGFHHCMCITPLICVWHLGEKQAWTRDSCLNLIRIQELLERNETFHHLIFPLNHYLRCLNIILKGNYGWFGIFRFYSFNIKLILDAFCERSNRRN